MTGQTRAERADATRARRWRIVRRWVYGVAIAAVPFAVYAGWIDPEASPIVLPLILALVMVKPDGTPEDVE
jgi:DMSO/TMAO reductase YedYZ heme-binding membrane subunit